MQGKGTVDRAFVLGIDSKYLLPAAVTIESIGRQLPGAHVVVMTYRMSRAQRTFLETAGALVGVEVSTHDVDAGFDGLPTRWHFSPASYLPFLIGDVCADYSVVVSLDADLIALQRLGWLLERVDLQGRTCAAVQDPFLPTFGARRQKNPPIAAPDVNDDTPYFNSGVMVIDVQAWRQRTVGVRALEWTLASPDQVGYVDQDGLNMALVGDWVPLDPRYNAIAITEFQAALRRTRGESWQPPRAWFEWEEDPFILHFMGPNEKPWVNGYPDGRNLDRYRSAGAAVLQLEVPIA